MIGIGSQSAQYQPEKKRPETPSQGNLEGQESIDPIKENVSSKPKELMEQKTNKTHHWVSRPGQFLDVAFDCYQHCLPKETIYVLKPFFKEKYKANAFDLRSKFQLTENECGRKKIDKQFYYHVAIKSFAAAINQDDLKALSEIQKICKFGENRKMIVVYIAQCLFGSSELAARGDRFLIDLAKFIVDSYAKFRLTK